jgi:hypothetical protein
VVLSQTWLPASSSACHHVGFPAHVDSSPERCGDAIAEGRHDDAMLEGRRDEDIEEGQGGKALPCDDDVNINR